MKSKTHSGDKFTQSGKQEQSLNGSSIPTGSCTTGETGVATSGKARQTRWGDMKKLSVRNTFKDYVNGLKDSQPFLKNPGFFKGMSVRCRQIIRERLLHVDPEGYKKLKRLLRTAAMEKRFLKGIQKESAVVLKRTEDHIVGVSELRYMDAEGLKHLLSVALAAGYKPEEVAAFGHMKVEDLNSMISQDDIREAAKTLPRAIVAAADQLVMRDLLHGMATPMTDLADKIATRRMKLAVTASREGRELRREDEVLQKQREDHAASRFGVDRKTGKIIDVEVEDEDTK